MFGKQGEKDKEKLVQIMQALARNYPSIAKTYFKRIAFLLPSVPALMQAKLFDVFVSIDIAEFVDELIYMDHPKIFQQGDPSSQKSQMQLLVKVYRLKAAKRLIDIAVKISPQVRDNRDENVRVEFYRLLCEMNQGVEGVENQAAREVLIMGLGDQGQSVRDLIMDFLIKEMPAATSEKLLHAIRFAFPSLFAYNLRS